MARHEIDRVLPLAIPPLILKTQEHGQRQNSDPADCDEWMETRRPPIVERNDANQIDERPVGGERTPPKRLGADVICLA